MNPFWGVLNICFRAFLHLRLPLSSGGFMGLFYRVYPGSWSGPLMVELLQTRTSASLLSSHRRHLGAVRGADQEATCNHTHTHTHTAVLLRGLSVTYALSLSSSARGCATPASPGSIKSRFPPEAPAAGPPTGAVVSTSTLPGAKQELSLLRLLY